MIIESPRPVRLVSQGLDKGRNDDPMLSFQQTRQTLGNSSGDYQKGTLSSVDRIAINMGFVAGGIFGW
jgi:hypothetical protein